MTLLEITLAIGGVILFGILVFLILKIGRFIKSIYKLIKQLYNF